MGAKRDAEITIGADASAVESAARKALAVWKVTGTGIAEGFSSATRSILGDLGSIVSAQGKVNFASQHQQVLAFEMATARMAVSVHGNTEAMRAGFEATGAAIGRRPGEVAAWTAEVGKLTYNFHGAGEAMRGVNGLAAETGRTAEDYRGLAVELGTVGGVAGDTTHAIGGIVAQSEALKNQGGIAAFADQVQGLESVVSHMAQMSEKEFLRVTAAAGVLGKGLNPQGAQRVQQAALGFVQGHVQDLERYLGHEVTDKNGQVTGDSAVQNLIEYRNKTLAQYGGDKGKVRKVLANTLGSYETAAAVMNLDEGELKRTQALTASNTPQAAQAAFNATDAGKRNLAEAQLATAARDLTGSASMLGRAADALQQFAAAHPLLSTAATGIVGGTTGHMLEKTLAGAGRLLSPLLGAAGMGGAASTVAAITGDGARVFVTNMPAGGLGGGGGGNLFNIDEAKGGAPNLAKKGPGLLKKFGAAVAAFGVGYEIGTALDDATGGGISDHLSGTVAGGGGKDAISNATEEAKANIAVALRSYKTRQSNEKAAGVRANAGIFEALGFDTGLKGTTGGVGGVVEKAEALQAEELRKALKEGVHITVHTTVPGVEATVTEDAASAEAGNQSGG